MINGRHTTAADRLVCTTAILALTVALAVTLSMGLDVRDAKAAFSGHNGNIVFQRNGDIWLTGPGIVQANLTPNTASFDDVDPAMSPRGRKVAFTSNRDGDYEIFTLDIYTGALTKITRNSVRDAQPTWSPSGGRIAYESTGCTPGSGVDIFSKSADGTGTPLAETCTLGDEFAPSWRPVGGDEIAYHSSGQVWVTLRGTGTYRAITSGLDTDLNPNWSPDGSRIVFQSNRASRNGSTDYEIYTARSSDGGDPQQITDNTTPDGNPAYSPSGFLIVYGGFASGDGDILISDSAGIVPAQPLVLGPTEDGSPDWGVAARPAAPGCTISGTFASDRITGDNLSNTICSLGGNDEVYGYGGNDTRKGGTGGDRLIGGNGADKLLGGDGRDTINYRDGRNGNDRLNGGPGRDRCIKDRREASIRSCP